MPEESCFSNLLFCNKPNGLKQQLVISQKSVGGLSSAGQLFCSWTCSVRGPVWGHAAVSQLELDRPRWRLAAQNLRPATSPHRPAESRLLSWAASAWWGAGSKEEADRLLKSEAHIWSVSLLPQPVGQTKSRSDRIRREKKQNSPIWGGAACMFICRHFQPPSLETILPQKSRRY